MILQVFFSICAIFFFLYTFICTLMTVSKILNLTNYLKENNYQRWREITSFKHYGPGCSNPSRLFPYIYNELDCNDENILKLKDDIRIILRYFYVGIVGYFVFFGIAYFLL